MSEPSLGVRPVRIDDEAEVPTPSGYRVESFQGAVPVAYQAGVGILDGLVNADAPTGDAHVEPVPVPPEDYRAQVALLQATAVSYTHLDVYKRQSCS